MNATHDKIDICFIAHFAYGALTGTSGHIGGVERQTALMARWLVKRGHKVSVITWGEGPDGDETVDGIRIIKLCRRNAGLPIARFFYPRWHTLVQAMKRADAEIYYHNCGEYITGQVAQWCRQNGKRFVYSVANDTDVDPSLPEMNLKEKLFYRYGIQKTDRIICQTEKQKRMLKEGFGLDSKVIPMPGVGPERDEFLRTRKEGGEKQGKVLWAARISPSKRLEFLLDIAERLPDTHFTVAGPTYGERNYIQPLLDKMERLENVDYVGRVDMTQMPELYRSHALFCSTSKFEGFPNTFLESWSHGLPIVSTFDPDGVIANQRLGLYATTVAEMTEGLRTLLSDPNQLQEMSDNARRYFEQNHSVDTVMKQFEALFYEVLGETTAVSLA